MKLISTTDFVIEQTAKVMAENNPKDVANTSIAVSNSYKVLAVYSRLLKKKLTIDMFIPCSVNGRRLLEPKNKYKGGGNAIGSTNSFTREYAQYLKGQDKVLFELPKGYKAFLVKGGLIHIEDYRDFGRFSNIESLLTFFGELKPAIILTKTAIKEIGL